jgi:hypothetical protein
VLARITAGVLFRRFVSREAAKGNAMDGVLSGERWLVLFVARAFQPEICAGDF